MGLFLFKNAKTRMLEQDAVAVALVQKLLSGKQCIQIVSNETLCALCQVFHLTHQIINFNHGIFVNEAIGDFKM